jgi:hypothetical protein
MRTAPPVRLSAVIVAANISWSLSCGIKKSSSAPDDLVKANRVLGMTVDYMNEYGYKDETIETCNHNNLSQVNLFYQSAKNSKSYPLDCRLWAVENVT